jgi:predicted acyl esterase
MAKSITLSPRSGAYRPYHIHDKISPLHARENYALDIEILPTSIIFLAGFRSSLEISGKGFKRDVPSQPNNSLSLDGSGPWLYTHPEDWPESLFGGKATVYAGGKHTSKLILPIIPTRN